LQPFALARGESAHDVCGVGRLRYVLVLRRSDGERKLVARERTLSCGTDLAVMLHVGVCPSPYLENYGWLV
jgi:hypothetical protein